MAVQIQGRSHPVRHVRRAERRILRPLPRRGGVSADRLLHLPQREALVPEETFQRTRAPQMTDTRPRAHGQNPARPLRPSYSGHGYLAGSMIVLALLMLFVPLPATAEYGDVVFNKRAEKAGMRPVIFSHWFHRIRFRCRVCHTEVGFEMRAGSNDIMMADIIEGRFCGMCHNNKIACGPQNCHLCHSGLPGLESGIRGGPTTGGPGKWG